MCVYIPGFYEDFVFILLDGLHSLFLHMLFSVVKVDTAIKPILVNGYFVDAFCSSLLGVFVGDLQWLKCITVTPCYKTPYQE